MSVKQNIKRWTAAGILISGLLVAGWLYADDSSTNICTNYSNNSDSEDGSDSSECCDTAAALLCQIDTDLNSKLQSVLSKMDQYLAATATFANNFLTNLLTSSNVLRSYIGNNEVSNNIKNDTTSTISQMMTRDNSNQLTITNELASKMPSPTANTFDASNFTMSQLMNNPGIDSSHESQVDNLILLLANNGNPVKNLAPNIAQQTQLVNVQEYQASLAALYAAQSNALNVLYGIKAERTVVPGLGSQVNASTADMSPMQLQLYNVNMALSLASDSEALNSSSLQDLAKASYFVQAQMLFQLYKLQEYMQQMNATMAVMQLQMLNSLNKEQLDILRQKATSSAS